jgi:hypothetical protein
MTTVPIRKRSMHEAIVGDWRKDRVPQGQLRYDRDKMLPGVRGLEYQYQKLTEPKDKRK